MTKIIKRNCFFFFVLDSDEDFDVAFACFKPMTLNYLYAQAYSQFPLKIIGTFSTCLMLLLAWMYFLSPKWIHTQTKCLAVFCFTVFSRDLPNIVIMPTTITPESIFANCNVCQVTGKLIFKFYLSFPLISSFICFSSNFYVLFKVFS